MNELSEVLVDDEIRLPLDVYGEVFGNVVLLDESFLLVRGPLLPELKEPISLLLVVVFLLSFLVFFVQGKSLVERARVKREPRKWPFFNLQEFLPHYQLL